MLGLSMLNPTSKHDMNPTWVFLGLGYKRVDLKATR